MKKLLLLIALLSILRNAVAQPATAALIYDCNTQPPLTTTCEGDDPISDGDLVYIYWDENGNGPDGTDDLLSFDGPCPANYSAFFNNSAEALGCPGGFLLDPALSFDLCVPDPPRLWILFPLHDNETCWRSEIFTLNPGFNEVGFQRVDNPGDTAAVENAIFCTNLPAWPDMEWIPTALPFVTSTNNKSLAADEDGTVHLLTHSGSRALYYYKEPGMVWSQDSVVVNNPDSTGAISDQALFVIEGGEDLLGVWEGNSRIWFGRQSTGENTPISPPGESAHTPDIAANSLGFIYVVWVADLGDSYELHYAWGDGAEWTLGTIPTNIGSFGLGASPRIAVDENGAAHVVFRGGDFGGYYAKHATNQTLGGTNWIVTPLQVPEFESYPGDVAVSSDGWVHAVSSGSNGWGMPGGVYRHERNPQGNWQFGIPMSLFEFDTLNGGDPAIALDTQGGPHTMWLEISGNIYTGNLYYTAGFGMAEQAYNDAQGEPAFAIDGLNYGHMVVRGTGNQYYYFRSEETLIEGVPRLTITPTELEFDSTEVGHSDFADVRLTNSGSAWLTVANLLVQGNAFNHPPEWVPVDLMPGEFFDVNLQFQPLAPGDFQGIAIFLSSAQSNPDTVFLSGRGYVIDDASSAPVAHDFSLNTLYPNPFNGEIDIEYSLANDSRVKLVVYDVLGREVARVLNGNATAGVHHVNWNCADCSAGVYLFELVAGSMRDVKKAVYLK